MFAHMPLTLYLVRHAQAFPNAASDFERMLTIPGQQEAAGLAERLVTLDSPPDVVLTSPAVRCVGTTDVIAAALGIPERVQRIDALYNAPINVLLDTLKWLGPNAKSAMIVGHNPSVSELVVYLSDHVFNFLPPAGCACLTIKSELWSQLRRGGARFDWVDTPERPYL
jgi:phosphohistidine phosphatase